jgi:hypothetical protein
LSSLKSKMRLNANKSPYRHWDGYRVGFARPCRLWGELEGVLIARIDGIGGDTPVRYSRTGGGKVGSHHISTFRGFENI